MYFDAMRVGKNAKVYWLNLQLKLPTSNYDVSTNKIIWNRVHTDKHKCPQKAVTKNVKSILYNTSCERNKRYGRRTILYGLISEMIPRVVMDLIDISVDYIGAVELTHANSS